MLILVFDTSTRNGTIGWLKLDETKEEPTVLDFAHTYLPAAPGHAERLLERMDFCLKSGDVGIENVDLMVIGKGPGTFTGLRIGFSTARSLSLVHRIPIVTVSTLQMLACNGNAAGPVAALIDARRKEVYAGLFNLTFNNGLPTATAIGREAVMKPELVGEMFSRHHLTGPIQLVGDGAIKYASEFENLGAPAPPTSVALNSCVMGLHGYRYFKTHGPLSDAKIEPEYLREPDARKPSAPFVKN